MNAEALFPIILMMAAVSRQQSSESLTPVTENSTGIEHLVVFPENIAHYHPLQSENKLVFTSLLPDTNIIIEVPDKTTETKTLAAGQSDHVTLDQRSELKKQVNSSGVISQITSNKRIIVQAISHRDNSTQSAVVISTDKFTTTYSIPPVPRISGTTYPDVQETVTEQSPFRLIILNGDWENTVTLEGVEGVTGTENVPLNPKQVTQHLMKTNVKMVTAMKPVAVLFGHPCAARESCTCGLLYTVLPPHKEDSMKFLIPPELVQGAETQTSILLSGNHEEKPFDTNSHVVEAVGTAILYRPGLLLPLIPESDFGACYVVTSINETQNLAVIVVHKNLTSQINVNGSDSTLISDWKPLKGTDYVSASIDLPLGNTFIWHSSAKIAVYYLGRRSTKVFGNPAAVISTTPDYRGCTVIPELITIKEPTTWRASVKVCKDNKTELITFSNPHKVTETFKKITNDNKHLQKVWIGMRRSSLNGEWYWANGKTINETNWDKGEPGTVNEGQCAIMNLNSSNYGWHDESCCEDLSPICYKDPVLLEF